MITHQDIKFKSSKNKNFPNSYITQEITITFSIENLRTVINFAKDKKRLNFIKKVTEQYGAKIIFSHDGSYMVTGGKKTYNPPQNLMMKISFDPNKINNYKEYCATLNKAAVAILRYVIPDTPQSFVGYGSNNFNIVNEIMNSIQPLESNIINDSSIKQMDKSLSTEENDQRFRVSSKGIKLNGLFFSELDWKYKSNGYNFFFKNLKKSYRDGVKGNASFGDIKLKFNRI